MGDNAGIQNASGVVESHGLSVLDIVKHALITVIRTLEKDDRLSLVVYSDDASLLMDFTAMDTKGRFRAEGNVKGMQPSGRTNLWGGLLLGLDTIRHRSGSDKNRSSALMILTDGQPNVVPSRGHQAMLKLYKEENHDVRKEQPPCPSIHTFGFGYNLDSGLLCDLSVEGSAGMYSFVPDSAFVGTAFVHSLSNILTTVPLSFLTIHIQPTTEEKEKEKEEKKKKKKIKEK